MCSPQKVKIWSLHNLVIIIESLNLALFAYGCKIDVGNSWTKKKKSERKRRAWNEMQIVLKLGPITYPPEFPYGLAVALTWMQTSLLIFGTFRRCFCFLFQNLACTTLCPLFLVPGLVILSTFDMDSFGTSINYWFSFWFDTVTCLYPNLFFCSSQFSHTFVEHVSFFGRLFSLKFWVIRLCCFSYLHCSPLDCWKLSILLIKFHVIKWSEEHNKSYLCYWCIWLQCWHFSVLIILGWSSI